MPTVLVTSVFLQPGDAVDRTLRDAGVDTVHAPLRGARGEDELIDLLVGVDGIVAASDPFTRRVLEASPSVRVIARTGVGFDAVDVAAATELGIAVCNAPGVNRQSVAEHAFALMLASARRLPSVLADVAAGGWQRPSGVELAGSTLGIVGLGAIGERVARIAAAFDMRVVAHDPFATAARGAELGVPLVALDDLLADADVVSLHLGLSDETRHLIDARSIARMRPHALLVNTARGGIVDQDALVSALADGRLGGAALDVVETEPLPGDHPLRTMPNVVLTPHVGGATVQARDRSGAVAARSVLDVLAGRRPDTLVTARPAA